MQKTGSTARSLCITTSDKIVDLPLCVYRTQQTVYFKSSLFMPGLLMLLEMLIELWFRTWLISPVWLSAMSFVFICVSVSIWKSRFCVQWIQYVSLWYCAELILCSLECMVSRPQSSEEPFYSLFKSVHYTMWASVSLAYCGLWLKI